MFKKKDWFTLKKVVFYVFLWILVCAQIEGPDCGEPAAPQNINLSTKSIDFGETRVGSSSIQTLIIKNPNNYTITIQSLELTDEAFRVGVDGELREVDLPFIIEGKAEKTLYIGFYPQEAREYTGSLVIKSVNERSDTDEVALRGVGVLE